MYSLIHPFLLDGYREIHGREKSGKRLANLKTNPAETWFCWSTISKLVVSRVRQWRTKRIVTLSQWRIIMLFIETEIFTEDVQKLLTDDEFSRFQFFLALNPDYGEVIPETGGLRKVWWVSGGKGKRAGVRVIYFHQVKHYEIRLLLIYRKGIKDDLSPQEKAMLRLLNTRW